MFTSKYMKVQTEHIEFITGLEKVTAPSGKQVSQLHTSIGNAPYIQTVRQREVHPVFFFLRSKIPDLSKSQYYSQFHHKSSLTSQCPARWNRTKVVGFLRIPSNGVKTVLDTLFRIPIVMLGFSFETASRTVFRNLYHMAPTSSIGLSIL